jgi:hypothetical protein
MSRGAQTFKQGDVTKAIKGAERAGLKVQRAEIAADGRIVLDFTQRAEKAAQDVNEWDDVK